MNKLFNTIKQISQRKTQILSLLALCLLINACTLLNPTISKSKYDQVKTGMTLEEVEKLVGKPGETTAEFAFDIPGVPNFPNGNQAFYQWKNDDSSSMTAVFVNDKLIFKSQVNLR